MMDFSKLKLVIWDLDDTFWNGTLSEMPIVPIKENVDLVKALVSRGIMCSIVSKNDFEQTKEQLENIGVWNYFVFSSINWEPKGQRIKSIIKEMNLRSQNVLFVDDNQTNLNEALYYNPELNVMLPAGLNELADSINLIGKDDSSLSRLSQYKILEKRTKASHEFKSEDSFLKKSKIRVSIHEDCINVVDRLFEMIDRTHQLNFTKNALCLEDLKDILRSKRYECRYIKCVDRFGDYGIVGFYCLETTTNELIHYLFSCRTLGLHIESFIYQLIGKPKLNIVPPVAAELIKKRINYIKIVDNATVEIDTSEVEHNVLFRGPCDIEAIAYYLNKGNITFESNRRSNHGGFIYLLGHSQILRDISSKKIFNSKFAELNAFQTEIYQKKYDVIVISLFSEALYGLYKQKNGDYYVVYGESLVDATYNDGELYLNKTANITFDDLTRQDYIDFANEFEYLGPTPYQLFSENINSFINSIDGNTKICFLLPPSLKIVENDENASSKKTLESGYVHEINEIIKNICKEKTNCDYIDTTKIAYRTRRGKKVYTYSSNTHLSRTAYIQIAKRLHKMYKKHIYMIKKKNIFLRTIKWIINKVS